MKPVQYNNEKKSVHDLDSLNERKREIKNKINVQEQQIEVSVRHLFSFNTVAEKLIQSVGKSVSVLDGFLAGYRLFRKIMKLIGR